MKNKKIIILTVFIVLFSLGTCNVKAANALSKGEKFTKQTLKDYYKTNMAVYDTVSKKDVYKTGVKTSVYGFNDPTGYQFVGYCADPGSSAANNYKLDRFLGDKSNSVRVQSHDLGLIEIIKNGYNQYNNSFVVDTDTYEAGHITYTLEGYDLYIATNIAVRAFTLGLFDYTQVKNLNGNYQKYYITANMERGLQWSSFIRDKAGVFLTGYNCSTSLGYEDYRACITKGFSARHSWYSGQYTYTYNSGDTNALAIIYGAKELFYIGVNKAYDVYTGAVTNATLTAKDNGVIEKEIDGEYVNEYYGATISFENFNAKKTDKKDIGKIYDIKLNVSNATNMTIGQLEWKNPLTNDWEVLNAQTNVIEVFARANSGAETVSGEIQLRFAVTRPNDEEKCKPASYTISYKYNDPSLEYIGAKLSAGDSKYQRMFIIQKNEGDLSDSLNGTIKCDAACETKISTPSCSLDEEKSTAKVEAPEKIKSCIIGKSDDAGNSYNLIDDNHGITDGNNPYCAVYCKEDYAEIKFQPIIENVKCGGYFKLTSYVKGTKTCYTGSTNTGENALRGKNSIDKEQYLEDIADAQKMMIQGRDLIMKAKEALAQIGNAQEHECSSCTGCTANGWTLSGSYAGLNPSNPDDEGFVQALDATKGFSYGSSPSCRSQYEKVYKDGKVVGSTCAGGSCRNGATIADIRSQIEADRQTGIGLVQAGKQKYETAMKQYNACTTAWTTEFAFEQKLRYYYDENRGESGDQYTPYYDLLEEFENQEVYYLEKDGEASESNAKITVCLNDANDKYECNGNGQTFNLSIDNRGLVNYNYNSAYGSVFKQRTYTRCTETQCKTEKQMISEASFVKKEVTKEQDYITPTVYEQIAPNGKITIVGAYSGNKVQLETLYNKLPTSTSSVGGGVFKLLLEDLGEFYSDKLKISTTYDRDDQDSLGRLIDFEGYNKDKSVAAAQGVTTFDGDYTCYYKNDCRPANCPDCEFTCEGEKCEWTICPDCNFNCVNCIFDLSKLNLNLKVITTTDVTSANRTYGYNWITSSNLGQLSLLTQKAGETIKEIEDLNEMIYNDNKDTDDNSSLAFSIKLTSSMINDIKDYNKKEEENGGYINDTLTCYDASIGGNTYKNIYCYSEFIDDLMSNYGDNITVSSNRINNVEQRTNNTQSSGYWTLYNFSGSLGEWQENGVIGGPSWK